MHVCVFITLCICRCFSKPECVFVHTGCVVLSFLSEVSSTFAASAQTLKVISAGAVICALCRSRFSINWGPKGRIIHCTSIYTSVLINFKKSFLTSKIFCQHYVIPTKIDNNVDDNAFVMPTPDSRCFS